ncbi:MAG TPA: DUF3016 domain-containing protein [Burkholderiaceae bacterium]|nr:DUF3016 domain-containing protein [Burkholderiaceae bacterium]
MKALGFALGLATLSLANSIAAAPAVEIDFVEPGRYADASPDGQRAQRDATLQQLREHMQGLGVKYLKEGDRLKIQVLDVDLAGDLEFGRANSQPVRVLRDGGIPRIDVRYTLTRDGAISQGEDRITDLSYMKDPRRCHEREPLCYEEHMLEVWFARRWR